MVLNHDELAARFAAVLANGNLGTRSRWALETALDAAETDTVSGQLVLDFPENLKKGRLEAHFTMNHRLGG